MKGQVPTEIVQLPNLAINVSDFIDFSTFSAMRCMTGILAFLFIGVIDVSGVIFGMASLADLTQEDGSIPGATPTFVAVAVSSIVSAATGGTPVIVYVESAAGIKEGGRTGLTAVIISVYFLLSLFFAPVLSQIPLIATSPVAILVGAMMMSQAVEIDWDNMGEAIPAFLTLITMPFTFSITNGIVLGLITAFLFYITTGQMFDDVKVLIYGPPETPTGASALELQPLQGAPASATKHSTSSAFSSDSPFYSANPPNNSDGRAYRASGSVPIPSAAARTHSGSFHNAGSLPETERHSFVDEHPFVRTPSLILRKRDAEAVRDAQGRSLSRDDSGGVHGSGGRRRSSQGGSGENFP
jgi:hypothetical protein